MTFMQRTLRPSLWLAALGGFLPLHGNPATEARLIFEEHYPYIAKIVKHAQDPSNHVHLLGMNFGHAGQNPTVTIHGKPISFEHRNPCHIVAHLPLSATPDDFITVIDPYGRESLREALGHPDRFRLASELLYSTPRHAPHMPAPASEAIWVVRQNTFFRAGQRNDQVQSQSASYAFTTAMFNDIIRIAFAQQSAPVLPLPAPSSGNIPLAPDSPSPAPVTQDAPALPTLHPDSAPTTPRGNQAKPPSTATFSPSTLFVGNTPTNRSPAVSHSRPAPGDDESGPQPQQLFGPNL